MSGVNNPKMGAVKRFLLGILIGVFVAGIFLLGYGMRMWTAPEGLSDLEHILKIIEKNYDGDFDVDEFIHAAVSGTLDKYSTYYTREEYEAVTLSREGISTGSLGVNFLRGSNVVYSVDGNSPAERAGVTEGGAVRAVKLVTEENYTEVKSIEELNAFLSGKNADCGLNFKISYGEEESEFELKFETFDRSYVWYQDVGGAYNMTKTDEGWSLKKRENPLKTQVHGEFFNLSVPSGAAYVRLERFMGQAADQLLEALNKMASQNIDSLVLDLRGNGGGYMDILCEIAGYLCPGKKGQTVSVAKYKSGDKYSFVGGKNIYDSFKFKKITVLADDGTASASEALIGAMLDYDGYYQKNIVSVLLQKGERGFCSYGKGIMQTTYQNISTGSAIKLTTAHIYWPTSGKCIHGDGITPETDARVIGVEPVSGGDALVLEAFK